MTLTAWSLLDSFLDLPVRADGTRKTPAAPHGYLSPAVHRWSLPAGSAAVPAARATVAAAVCSLDRGTVEVALLLTSEVVTTMVSGGSATPMALSLTLSEEELRVQLEAPSRRPADASPPADVPPVRLLLINAFATDWGLTSPAQSLSGHRSMWFSLSLRGGGVATSPNC